MSVILAAAPTEASSPTDDAATANVSISTQLEVIRASVSAIVQAENPGAAANPSISKAWWGNGGWGRWRGGWGNGGRGWGNGGWGNGGWRNGGWGNGWHNGWRNW